MYYPFNQATDDYFQIAVRTSQAELSLIPTLKAVIHEIDTRTKYRVLTQDSDSADATLHGTILSQTVAPLTYDGATGQSSSYLITITAKVLLTAHDGHVLYRNDAFVYHEQYQSTQDLSGFIQEDNHAVNRVAKDFAQAVVSDMLESF